jgi:hypothetical protein
MTLTPKEMQALAKILDERVARRDPKIKAEEQSLRKIARDPIRRRKQFKIVPGAALSVEAAKLAQFYERAPKEQRAAFNVLLALFSA